VQALLVARHHKVQVCAVFVRMQDRRNMRQSAELDLRKYTR
jgi:hypothetical protein